MPLACLITFHMKQSSAVKTLQIVVVWLSLLLGGWACSSDDSESGESSSRGGADPEAVAEEVAPSNSRGRDPDLRLEIASAGDARELSVVLRSALRSDRPGNRLAGARALAQLHTTDALPLLSLALRDPEPTVREVASMGIAALGPDEAADRESLLLGALASEGEDRVIAAMIQDLGRIGGRASRGPILHAVASEEADVRIAACRGLAE